MPSTELLDAYLNDHLAGSAAGIELAEKLLANNEGTPFGAVLQTLAAEIKEDRATLEGLMGRLGIEKSTVKQATGWVFEKLSRVRFDRRLTGSSDLARLLETETLSLGIEGKLLMWRALQQVGELDAAELDRLAGRARRQREALEPYRLGAAAAAFTGSDR
jgi:hypothetical protein